jgi:hypothetical protein
LEAVGVGHRQWKFKPLLLNGKAVEVKTKRGSRKSRVPVRDMSGLPGGFNGSMQHQLQVYFAEFKGPNPLAGIDSKKTPS